MIGRIKASGLWLIGILLVGFALVGCAECGNNVCETIFGETAADCPEDCDGDLLPDVVHHTNCGNGIIDPGETCEAEADCPGTTNHCNRETCQCGSCEDMPSDFPSLCYEDEQCVEEYGEGYFCNQAACNCFTCPADSDGCRVEADCPDTSLHCNTALCECVPCTEMALDFPGACSTNEQCLEENGPGWFCNQGTCNCMSCPPDSDGCTSQTDCPGEDNHCHLPTCDCITCAETETEHPEMCSTDEECVEDYGEGYFCNLAACNCFTCPEGSMGCRSDSECVDILGDETAYCVEINCDCVIPCGDGWCDVETENTDLCPEDCPCVDDDECSPGEGFSCADCGEAESDCGAPCEESEDCIEGLACFRGICWDDCICENRCGEEPDDEGDDEPSCRQCQDNKECVEHCGAGATCNEGCCVCP